MKKKLSILTVLNVILMLSNFIIQLLSALFLGADWERDALFISMSIPSFFNIVLTASIGVVMTPFAILHEDSETKLIFYNKLLLIVTIYVSIIVLILYIGSFEFTKILAPGFSREKVLMTNELMTFSILIIPIQSATLIISSYWITIQKVLIPTLTTIFGNILTMSLILWFKDKSDLTPKYILFSFISGYMLTLFLIGIYYFSQNNFIPKFKQNIIGLNSLLKSSFILILLILLNRSSIIIENRIASNLESGTISYLRYSAYFTSFLVSATTIPVITVYYSELCLLWKNNEIKRIISFLERGIFILSLVSLLIIGSFILTVKELLLFVKDWTKFSLTQIDLLSFYLKISVISYLFLSLSGFLGRLFYISNNFLKGAILDLGLLFTYIIISYIFVFYWKGFGLAVASVLQATLAFIGVYWTLTKKVLYLDFDKKNRIIFFNMLFIWCFSFLIILVLKEQFAEILNTYLNAILSLILYLTLFGTLLFYSFKKNKSILFSVFRS